ncbi:hypothetical protein T10_3380 [Trichinella papuae]|uniref:DUF4371 domain-containing protein n=1 Tax=Trichinella papuae TaxID=268474 RepID=A0A0V1M043_9BILA|nr:hypothetical protein T10_3380 [Trichinella papuae]
METLATRTRGEDIFLAVKRACIKFGVDFKSLRGICTDGAPVMVGKVQGLVARFSNYVSNEHALIDSKEIPPEDIPSNSFSGVIDVLLKEFSDRFEHEISKFSRILFFYKNALNEFESIRSH